MARLSSRPQPSASGGPGATGAPGAPEAGPPEPSAVLPAVLFGLTLLSTTFVGALHQLGPGGGLLDALRQLPRGLVFSLPLCAILLCHEAGHFLVARRHGVAVSFPLFIPFPLSAIGTLGAVINVREEIRDRGALLDIAAAGPILGLCAALPLLALGLHLSPVAPVQPGDALEGQSLLYLGVKFLVKGQHLPANVAGRLVDVNLHPMALAGWVGLLLTFINLLPIGQLDGGRVAAALLGPRAQAVGRASHGAMLAVAGLGAARYGAEAALPWLVGAAALVALGRWLGPGWYPQVDPAPLGPGRRLLGAGLALLGVLLFMPYFMRKVP